MCDRANSDARGRPFLSDVRTSREWAGVAVLAGLAAGSFLYLGFHALHSEWKQRRAVPAFVVASFGAGLAALLGRVLG